MLKIQGLFKKLLKAKDLSIQLQTADGETIAKTDKLKKNKFTLSVKKIPDDYKGETVSLSVVISDENGGKSNFKNKKGKPVDFSPDEQSFDLKVNSDNDKYKLKINPDTGKSGKSEESGSSEITWKLGDILSLNTPGVSPHIEASGSGYRLAYPSDGITKIDDLTGLQLTNRGSLDRISDLTVVESGDGVRRAYYVEHNPSTNQKEIFTAEISEDWLTLSNPITTGFSDGGSNAWGVPDAVRLPDGRVRLYWVQDPPAGGSEHREWIVSATSTDIGGTSFTMDKGQRTTGGYVDFEVLQAEPNDWIAVMSSTPETVPDQPQGIFVATSEDGLSWDVNPENLAPTSMSYLDPTGVAVGPNQWKLVLAESSNILGARDYNLVATTLTMF